MDTNWIDNSKYASAKDWDKIVGNTSGTPTQEERDLDRPRAASKMLTSGSEKVHFLAGFALWMIDSCGVEFPRIIKTTP